MCEALDALTLLFTETGQPDRAVRHAAIQETYGFKLRNRTGNWALVQMSARKFESANDGEGGVVPADNLAGTTPK